MAAPACGTNQLALVMGIQRRSTACGTSQLALAMEIQQCSTALQYMVDGGLDVTGPGLGDLLHTLAVSFVTDVDADDTSDISSAMNSATLGDADTSGGCCRGACCTNSTAADSPDGSGGDGTGGSGSSSNGHKYASCSNAGVDSGGGGGGGGRGIGDSGGDGNGSASSTSGGCSPIAMMEFLVKAGQSASAPRAGDFYTPLHCAVGAASLPAAAALIRLGADVNAVAQDDTMPLTCAEAELAAAAKAGDGARARACAAVRDLLLDSGAKRTWRRERTPEEVEREARFQDMMAAAQVEDRNFCTFNG
ncbi:hypothetical protein JKP88DRAFT_349722 [Tribonema minus]|uniref:Uncharacterized protein n=1 Tax=Tribonema minus TaxID=303371 RepID=A0A836CC10_9STRA|nr:hypothetical protein JKP88DRAFT_349722 [Tribonema minus]